MLLVLNYHRIVENASATGNFFDVSVDEIDKHMRAAKQIWGSSVSPAEVQREKCGASCARTGFMVTFDDGTADHYHLGAPALERNGVCGVFFVSTALLGKEGYLTLSQCQELQDRGHAIESHSHDHKSLLNLTKEELRSQLGESRRRLRDCGLGQAELLAPPGGYSDEAVAQAARAVGYRALRTLKCGYNRRLNPFCVESITMQRRTAGKLSALLLSPCLEPAKKAAYRAKEMVKTHMAPTYFLLRSRGLG
jgi:peptidoglycan/xylan/chitin deacetylase (PgdA/CDA1 family)